jgi:hypothetical protein
MKYVLNLGFVAVINNYWTPEIWYVDEIHTHKDRVDWRSGTSEGFY